MCVCVCVAVMGRFACDQSSELGVPGQVLNAVDARVPVELCQLLEAPPEEVKSMLPILAVEFSRN